MEEKKFEAKLSGIDQSNFPLVSAAFQGKDGKVYIGVMLIDTGSVNCILNKSVLSLMDGVVVNKDESMSIYSLHSAAKEFYTIDFHFKMGHGEFSELFYINESVDFDHMFEGFIGIIGHEFLRKHNLVLDYSTKTLHVSDGTFDAPADCEFFFPMEIGIKQYNIPIVGLIGKDKEYVLVADSGANKTLLSKEVLEESDMSLELSEKLATVEGIDGEEIDVSIYKADLCLLSVGGTETHPKIINYKDEVQAIDPKQFIQYEITDADGNALPPISGLLSSAFMKEHNWVLDFGLGIMYSRGNKVS